jgi:hypothetical protein
MMEQQQQYQYCSERIRVKNPSLLCTVVDYFGVLPPAQWRFRMLVKISMAHDKTFFCSYWY